MAITRASIRRRRLKAGIFVANGILFVLTAWILIGLDLSFLVLLALAACPFAAIWIAHGSGNGILLMETKGVRKRPHLSLLVLIPCSALSLHALLTFDMIDWWQPLLVAVPASTGFALPAMRVVRRQGGGDVHRGDRLALVFLFVLGTGLFWSLILDVNGLRDEILPDPQPMVVTGKHSGGYRHVTFYLTLRNASYREEDFHVPVDLYHLTEPGATRCVFVHRGVLGLRWYSVDLCPQPVERRAA